LPTSLAGVQVTINGTAARLSYVSDSQINFLAPSNLAPGPANISVQTVLGTSSAYQAQVESVAPGIFFDTLSGYGAILIAGTASVTQVRPAVLGEFIEVYCTGLGPMPQVTATIGGVAVPVTYAGPTTFDGLQQVNLQIVAGTPGGTQNLVLSVNGIPTNTVKVQIASGAGSQSAAAFTGVR
jgi:uncharacterized protein (TIGR03437 family)